MFCDKHKYEKKNYTNTCGGMQTQNPGSRKQDKRASQDSTDLIYKDNITLNLKTILGTIAKSFTRNGGNQFKPLSNKINILNYTSVKNHEDYIRFE